MGHDEGERKRKGRGFISFPISTSSFFLSFHGMRWSGGDESLAVGTLPSTIEMQNAEKETFSKNVPHV